jgi:hypothetical protein
VNKRKPVLGVKEPTAEEAATTDTTMPKNPSANTIPSKGYVLEVDGKFKSEFETSDAAMKSALDLKKKYPQIKVNVYDAKEHARTLVDLTEKSAVPIGPASRAYHRRARRDRRIAGSGAAPEGVGRIGQRRDRGCCHGVRRTKARQTLPDEPASLLACITFQRRLALACFLDRIRVFCFGRRRHLACGTESRGA